MCILFLSASKNPCPGGYKLIVASNRDETFARPTNPVQFWSEHSDIIGGKQDMLDKCNLNTVAGNSDGCLQVKGFFFFQDEIWSPERKEVLG